MYIFAAILYSYITVMKKIRNISKWLLPVAVFASISNPLSSVSAANNCGNTNTYFSWGKACDDSQDGGQIMGLFLTIFNWLAIGVSLAVIAGIIYGAITYTTAGGAQDRAKKGIDIIRNSVIGLVLYFAMFSLLNFLVPGGLFK